MGNYNSVWGKGPEAFQFRENKALINTGENSAQNIINHFKDWLPKVAQVYESLKF